MENLPPPPPPDAPPPPPPPPPEAPRPAAAIPSLHVLLPAPGVALAVIGAFGTWVTGPGYSSGGLHHGGKITIFVALAAAALLGYAWKRETIPWLVGLGAVALVLLATAAVNIGNVKNENIVGFFGAAADLNVGWGLWLTTVGGLIIAAAVGLRLLKP
jgi:hypothetical protein